MNNGKLSKTDVKYNKIYLDESTCALFKPFVNQKIKIVDEDDCEFYFDVNWQLSNRKNKMSYDSIRSVPHKVYQRGSRFRILSRHHSNSSRHYHVYPICGIRISCTVDPELYSYSQQDQIIIQFDCMKGTHILVFLYLPLARM